MVLADGCCCCAVICKKPKVLHEGPCLTGGLLIAVVEVDWEIPDEQRAVPLHEVSNDGATRTKRWTADTPAQTCRPLVQGCRDQTAAASLRIEDFAV